MWKIYSAIILRYPCLSLSGERRWILEAQKGSKKSKHKLVLSHVGFLIFRIHKIVFPSFLQRFGDDLLTEVILIVYKKIEIYNLDYRNKEGNPNPVKFISYIWKRIDGFIIDYLKKETSESKITYKENLSYK